jgi:hypothetical protein
MCNAWNHPQGCTCGWGGEGHLGEGSGLSNVFRSSFKPSLSINLGLYPSYVNPNAICPVCGEIVFFYQSPFGGRVFFDELGPPWSKHPCTDNGDVANLNKSNVVYFPPWLHSWNPLYIDKYDTFSTRLSIFTGRSLYDLRFFTNKDLKYIIVEYHADFESETIRFIKEVDGVFEIEFLRKDLQPTTIKAWNYIRMRYIKKSRKSTFLIEPASGPSFKRCLIHKAHLSRESLKKIHSYPNQPFEFDAQIDSFLEEDIYFKEVNR